MSINLKKQIVGRLHRCAICGGPVSTLISLSNLPLTGLFAKSPKDKITKGADQKFLFCSSCRHGQLLNQFSPSFLYGKSYSFHSGQSETGRAGTQIFLKFLNKVAGKRKFKCILDVGCNDLLLLNLLKGRGKHRIGVDPIWAGRKKNQKNGIKVVGKTVEQISREIPIAPDLIVCRHTLEHIANPRAVLRKLFEMAAPDALFIFEMPRLEWLVRNRRFDQIFHHHLQYFSLHALAKLVSSEGGWITAHQDNPQAWGAMLVAFKNKPQQSPPWKLRTGGLNGLAIKSGYRRFSTELLNVTKKISRPKGKSVYGYGAAQLLPVMAYHMKNDLRNLKGILDDDKSKWELHFRNLPLQVLNPNQVKDLKDSAVMVTAIDNAQPILKRLKSLKVRSVILPLLPSRA